MYLLLNETRYPCSGTPALIGDTLCFVLPEEKPNDIGEVVALFSDEGFPLAEWATSEYPRWGVNGDILIITKLSGQGPISNLWPELSQGPSNDTLAAAVVGLTYELDTMKLKLGGFTV